MKKFIKYVVYGACVVSILVGCSKSETVVDESVTVPDSEVGIVDLSGINHGVVTLGEYKNLEVEKVPVEVTDDEVDSEISLMLESEYSKSEVDRPSQEGDIVTIDYTGLKDGVAFDGGSATNFDFIIGETNFIEGFQEGLMGVVKGEEKNLNLTFPADYREETLAGQDVVFEIKVHSVAEKATAELNDEYVKNNTSFNTVEEYRESVKNDIRLNKEAQAQEQVQSQLLDQVIAGCNFDIPDEALEANYTNLLESYMEQAEVYGMDFETLAGMYSRTGDELKKELKEVAEYVVKQRLVFNAIVEAEGIEITTEDEEALALESGFADTAEMFDTVGEFGVRDFLVARKGMEFITTSAVVK